MSRAQAGVRDVPVMIRRRAEQHDYEVDNSPDKTVLETWASVRHAGSRETEIARTFKTVVSHAVEIDYPHVMIFAHRDYVQLDDGRVLNIVSHDNVDMRSHTLKIMCMEVQS